MILQELWCTLETKSKNVEGSRNSEKSYQQLTDQELELYKRKSTSFKANDNPGKVGFHQNNLVFLKVP